MKMDHRVSSLIDKIDRDAASPLQVSLMAQSMNLSASRCHYLFKKNIGVTPIQYVRKIRLDKARVLLETTFLSVKQIMHVVGINDGSHFGRAFKVAYGLSPAMHRNNCRTKTGQTQSFDLKGNQ